MSLGPVFVVVLGVEPEHRRDGAPGQERRLARSVTSEQRAEIVERDGRKADFRAGRGRLHNLTFKRRIFRVRKLMADSRNPKIRNSNRQPAPERRAGLSEALCLILDQLRAQAAGLVGLTRYVQTCGNPESGLWSAGRPKVAEI